MADHHQERDLEAHAEAHGMSFRTSFPGELPDDTGGAALRDAGGAAPPPPRCPHDRPMADHAGERLEPPCGCRLPTPSETLRGLLSLVEGLIDGGAPHLAIIEQWTPAQRDAVAWWAGLALMAANHHDVTVPPMPDVLLPAHE